jgi:3-hydroxybutyryl-CoA dehydratase
MRIKNYTFDDIEMGMIESFDVTVTEAMVDNFRDITGDINPLHSDNSFAHRNGYDGRVVYGMLTASFYSTLAGVWLPGKNSLIQSISVKFLKPVMLGDKLHVEGKVTELHNEFHMIIVDAIITNQDGKKVSKAKIQIGVQNFI